MSNDTDIPKQAVILAGGRGVRLRPLTDTIPKPMIPFHGKPFLAYLISLLKDQGFDKILLLLGWLPHIVQNHFGDGKDCGVQIEYSVAPEEYETGARLIAAKPLIDPCFLLMYCDNYWPMRMREMWEHFLKTDALAQITVYANSDGYTKNNVRVENGMVVCYDKKRTMNNLQGVEIGFAIVKNPVLDLIPGGNVNFEKEVFPRLVAQHRLSAYVTEHRYYSVGSHERLPLTDTFLHRRPAIILDRDGVLNEKAPAANYIRSWEEFKWLPGSKEAIRLLKDAGYLVIVVTNQAGIARKIMAESDLLHIHEKMKQALLDAGGMVDAIYYCPHGWDDGCSCRKPKPGMLFQAQRDFHLDLTRIFFIGDDVRDQEAGIAAGCKTLQVNAEFSLLKLVKKYVLQTETAQSHA